MTGNARGTLGGVRRATLVGAAALLLALSSMVFGCGKITDPRVPPDSAAGAAGHADAAEVTPGGAGAAQPSLQAPCLGPCDDDISKRPQPLPRPSCPEQEPTLGDKCEHERERCGYGSASVALCRHYYDCIDGVWGPSTKNMSPCEAPPAVCSPTPPENGKACPGDNGIPCDYDLVSCFCLGFRVFSSPGAWFCYGPPRDPRCPAKLPNVGEGCADQGIACSYGRFDCESLGANHGKKLRAMSCGNHGRVGILVGTLLLSCGGRASSDAPLPESNSSGAGISAGAGGRVPQTAPGATAGDAPGSGGATNHVPPVAETKGPLAENRDICDDYLRIWRVRLSELPPGNQLDFSGACNNCLRAHKPGCYDGLPAECGPSIGCIDSHCLCPMAPPISRAFCAEEPRDDLCACVAACLPRPAAPCDAFWIGHFKCMADACRDVCGGP
jgi:hypothetical protein